MCLCVMIAAVGGAVAYPIYDTIAIASIRYDGGVARSMPPHFEFI